MGNIQRDVVPMRVKFPLTSSAKEVNRISKHQPIRPHLKKFFQDISVLLEAKEIDDNDGCREYNSYHRR